MPERSGPRFVGRSLVAAVAVVCLLFAATPARAASCPAFQQAQKDLIAAQKAFTSCVAAAKGKVSGCKSQGQRVLELTKQILAGPKSFCEPKPSFTTGLGDDIDKAINKSPKFRDLIKDLLAKGYVIEYGQPGKGTFINKDEKRIVIDPSAKGNTNVTLASLAHEAGHAGYVNKKQTPPDGLTKEEYVKANVNDLLDDEGEATLKNIELRDELAKAGIKISIAGKNASKYEKIYKQYLKDKDREKARRAIGEIFAKNENPSTAPEKTYWEYYSKPYEDYYDKWKNLQGKKP